eukprot:TRINITY_DN2836_c0_g1_i2.p1 TRINITY_DN2836_c0_g1~~TRINITY_DN2836_c0_g1_i2.p1  ORF type:complete len:683 (-),score=66.46 TRINITY_DN2836_c0_g1_i2:262-2310(-)
METEAFAIGKDVAECLGKDITKQPKFARFTRPTTDIAASVLRMRSLSRARRAFRTRSWETNISVPRTFKVPRFERFAMPIGDIQTAVQQMRLAAAAARARKQRSWAASFHVFRAQSAPQHARFANPPVNIREAVQDMRRTASAQRALKARTQATTFPLMMASQVRHDRSWMTSYSFASDSIKLPLHRRFAKAPTDITASVLRMRSLSRARRMFRTRSWEATFSFPRTFKTPKFARFAIAIGDIKGSVLEMREKAAWQSQRKQRSWSAAFRFFKNPLKQPHFHRFLNPPTDIQLAVLAMRERIKRERAEEKQRHALRSSTSADIDSGNDTAFVQHEPSSMCRSTVGGIAQSKCSSRSVGLEKMLRGLEFDVRNIHDHVNMVELRLTRPELYGPPAPSLVENSSVHLAVDKQPVEYLNEYVAPPTERQVRRDCVRCERLLRNLKTCIAEHIMEYDSTDADVDQLIADEQARQDQQAREVDELINDELGNRVATRWVVDNVASNMIPSSNQEGSVEAANSLTWVAGSPAAASRHLRRKWSSSRLQETAYGVDSKRESSLTRVYQTLDAEIFCLDSGESNIHDHESKAPRKTLRSAMALDLESDGRCDSSQGTRDELLLMSKRFHVDLSLQPILQSKCSSSSKMKCGGKPFPWNSGEDFQWTERRTELSRTRSATLLHSNRQAVCW